MTLHLDPWTRDFDVEESFHSEGAHEERQQRESVRVAREWAEPATDSSLRFTLTPLDAETEYADEFPEYFEIRGWRYQQRTLLVGAMQDDRDQPWFVMAVIL